MKLMNPSNEDLAVIVMNVAKVQIKWLNFIIYYWNQRNQHKNSGPVQIYNHNNNLCSQYQLNHWSLLQPYYLFQIQVLKKLDLKLRVLSKRN